MENENTTLRLVEELVSAKDELSGVQYNIAITQREYRETKEKLDNLIDIILDNCELDYTGETLSISDRKDKILAFVSFINPLTYRDRLEELSRLKDRQEELERLKAEESKNNKSKKEEGKK